MFFYPLEISELFNVIRKHSKTIRKKESSIYNAVDMLSGKIDNIKYRIVKMSRRSKIIVEYTFLNMMVLMVCYKTEMQKC